MTSFVRAAMAMVLVLTSVGCTEHQGSSDADSSFSIAAEGGVEEAKRVRAEFEAIDGGMTVGTWELRLRDTRPWTVTLTLIRQMQGPPEAPPVGTYEIGYRPVDSRVFSAILVEVGERRGESREYSTFHSDTGGTLTITESGHDLVAGTFEFSAARDGGAVDGGPERIVVSSGEFRARPR